MAENEVTRRETPRMRARRETIAEIVDVAKQHIAAQGASSLSLRAIARELEMTSSAIYRYFPSRDELLTDLIVDAYDALGAAVERADAVSAQRGTIERWREAAASVRSWARANPSSYALLFGTPVPGYAAPPERTIVPATRSSVVFLSILADGHAAGEIEIGSTRSGVRAVDAELAGVRDRIAPGLPMMVVGRALTSWMAVFGLVSFELFGQTHNVLDDHDAFFSHAVDELARFIGFTVRRR